MLFVTVTEACIGHPALRAVFNEDETAGRLLDPNDEGGLRATALTEALGDAMERALLQQRSKLLFAGLGAWMEDSIRHSAFYRQRLRQQALRYDDAPMVSLDRIEAELVQSH